MNADMTCRGMKFEVGKTYHVDGEIIPCRNGLHFCKKLTSVFAYYKTENGNRFFEVEALEPIGTIKTEGQKSVTSDLTIIRELTITEINRAGYAYNYSYSCGNGRDYGYGYYGGNGRGYGYNYGGDYDFGCGNGCNGNSRGGGFGNSFGVGHGIQKILLYV